MRAVRLVLPAPGQGNETEHDAAAAFGNATHSGEEIKMNETGEHRSNDGPDMTTLHVPSNAFLVDETRVMGSRSPCREGNPEFSYCQLVADNPCKVDRRPDRS